MKKSKKAPRPARARKSPARQKGAPKTTRANDVASPSAAVRQSAFREAFQLYQAGKESKAEAACRKIVKADPDHADAWHVLGIVCRDQGRHEEGIRHIERAIALDGSHPDTYNNLGEALSAADRHADALAAYDKALELRPDYALAHDNRGLTLNALGRLEEAIASFRRALEIQPTRTDALSMVAEISRRICDWSAHTELRAAVVERVKSGRSGINPFWFLSYCDQPELLLRCARLYAEHEVTRPKSVKPRLTPGEAGPIRIAYLSADFREHPVSHQIVELIEQHDRDKFEIIAISFGPDDGSLLRRRLERAFDTFIDVRARGDREIAQLIAKQRIHIAVDLMGYTADLRPGILACKPAPIQVSYLGYPGTMGSDEIDYILVDPFVAPSSQQSYFSEALVQLPDCYVANHRQRPLGDKPLTRFEVGLPEQAAVFCAFHEAYKITPEMFSIWMRLLKSSLGSVLWLISDNESVQENLRREASDRGVEGKRLIFAPRTDWATHLARLKLADLFLDTSPFNAQAAACDALWVGVPVLTCPGASFASRVAGSLVRAMDAPELITSSLEDYEKTALDLVRNSERLSEIRQKLERNRDSSALFDSARFTANLERAYAEMMARWRGGLAPAPIMIPSPSE